MKIAKYAVAAGLAALSLNFGNQPAGAWPTGPSAKVAARLKYYPPKNWLEHYLGDDRYKVAGGVWRVVSTDLDGYYHRPDCPNMLRQDAGQVIGFASPNDAKEAGYSADPSCSPDAPSVIFGGRRIIGGAGGTVTLADNASSLTLPVGWSRSQSQLIDMKGLRIGMDLFTGKSGKATAVTFSVPSLKADFAQFLSYEGFKQYQQQVRQGHSALDSTGMINSQFSSMFGRSDSVLKTAVASPLRVGGLNGVTLLPPAGSTFRGGSRAIYVLPKGNKMYIIGDETKNGEGVKAIVRSLKPG